MYDRILVPTDGSEGAALAFDHAVDLASQSDAELHVVHAVDPTTVPPEIGMDDFIERLRSTGETLVEDLRERGEAAGLTVEASVLTGPPADTITEYVTDHDIDLVVMGTHGRTGLGRWLLGSVTERVVRICPVPVLTVREPEAEV